MKILKLLLACAMLLGMASAPAFAQTGICPQTVGQYGLSDPGNAWDCNLLYIFNSNGTVTVTTPYLAQELASSLAPGSMSVASGTPLGVYESDEDALIGVINNSGAPLTEFALTSQYNIFKMVFPGNDGDGICSFIGCGGFTYDISSSGPPDNLPLGIGPFLNYDYLSCNPSETPACLGSNVAGDTTGYGGPNAYFTATDVFNGVVHFGSGGIPDGGTDYFSLEAPATLDTAPCVNDTACATAAVPEPETYAMLLAGLAVLGWTGRRRNKKTA